MMHAKLCVANWKMQKSYVQAVSFCQQYAEQLNTHAAQAGCQVVLCPSYDALASVAPCIQTDHLALGAQDVSRHAPGAYTGQVSAASLAEIGCRYTIVGHSERRIYCHETSIDVAHKCQQLIKQQITPIICIGETADERKAGNTEKQTEQQLAPVLATIEQYPDCTRYIIAYEPIWAIGTGIRPTAAELETAAHTINRICQAHTNTPMSLLYGGSVTPKIAPELLALPFIDGFLVGGASLKFNSLCSVVSAFKNRKKKVS